MIFVRVAGIVYYRLEGMPVVSYLPTRLPDYFPRDGHKFHLLFVSLRFLETLPYHLKVDSQTFKLRA